MINMSYCRFENTLRALLEVNDDLDDNPLCELSKGEDIAAGRLMDACHQYIELYTVRLNKSQG